MTSTDSRPCQLCHFCVFKKNDIGAACVWYDGFLTEEEVNYSENPLRVICRNDGNNFRWRLPNISPLDYAKWVRDYSHIRRDRLTKNASLVISIISLLVSLTTALLKFKGG